MKKCPTCEKTFEDNLKFCQTDGTPLVALEEPEDPYKTTVANASDLPIPPLDMFKTMVASPLPPDEVKPEVVEELPAIEPVVESFDVEESPSEIPTFEEPKLPEPEPEIDLLKTMVATDFPPFESASEPETIEEPKFDTPPSPFESAPIEPVAQPVEEVKVAAPEPPKFSEPDIKPPSFGEVDSEPEPVAVNSPPAPDVMAEPDALTGNPFENADPRVHHANDLTTDSPYGDVENVPIPSPFDMSMPPSYQIPSAPLPQNKVAEGISPGGSPFANDEIQGNQQLEAQGWNPPALPNSDWQNNPGGQNLSNAGSQGPNQSLAIGSLISGIISMLSLVGSIIPIVGIICGIVSLGTAIGAIVTGFLGRSRANNKPEEYGGSGLALGGIITGALTLLGIGAYIILIVAVLGFYGTR
jgi:hypothetical protein